MTRWLVESSLRLRFLVVVAAAALMVFGVVQLRDVKVDVFPEFAPPYVEIQTESLGLSAEEVEQLVTVPMEEILHGVSWVQTMRSESVPGLSKILLVFQPGTDLMRARALVQERLAQTNGLPTKSVSKPPVMLPPLSSTSRVMMIGLSSKKLSLIDLGVLTRWTIRPRLMGVSGVANVAVWGQRQRQLQVQVEPDRLRANGVTLQQVIKTAGDAMWVSPLTYLAASTPGVTGGFIDTATQRLNIRHLLPISSAEDLSRVRVAGAPLRLGEVADVVEGHQPLIGDAVVNDGPGLLLVVEKFPWGNTLDVTRGVENALTELRPGLAGVEIDSTVFRPASFIEMSIGNLTGALLIGCILVVLVLGLFLFEWRTALISVVAIPLSLVAAGLVLYFRGATINTMVLAGLLISVGVIVDDAIIDVENIVRRLRQHRQLGSAKSTAQIVLEGSLEVRGAIVFATLITVLAVVPVFFLEGLSGAFFRPVAMSYALAVLASMAVALTVTPALGLLLLKGASLERRESPIVRGLQRAYGAVLSRIVGRPRPVYVALVASMLVGLAVVPSLGQSLLPAFKERDLIIDLAGAPGTSHPAMIRIAADAGRELRTIPGVRDFAAHVGRAVMGDRVVGVNSAEEWVSLAPTADYDKTVAAVEGTIAGYPGLSRDVLTYLRQSVRQVLTGTGDPIVVRVFGPDLNILRQKAEQVRQEMSKIDGIVDPRVELLVEEPQVEIKVDLAAAQPYGLKPGDVRRAAATLVTGLEVGSLFEEQKVFDVVVAGAPATHDSLTKIRELLIDTPDGGHVRLGDLADVRIAPTPNVIKREGASRRIDVGANVRGRDLGAVSREVTQRLQAIDFPLEYHPEVLGEFAERQAAERRMLGFAVVAAAGVFLLLQAAFGSWRLASLAFLALPSALVGGVLAAQASGGVVSLGSLVGFFTVLGIAARNGIMLISHYQHLERHEDEPFGLGLVLRGARERLSPILMTALATGLALVPVVVVGDIAGTEIARPMAIVILGGLVTSTLLNLFVVPVLYLRFAPKPEAESSTARAGQARLEPQTGVAIGGGS